MSFQEYVKQLSSYPRWELLNMRKALSMMQVLNSPDENIRLQAVKFCLRRK